MTTKDFCHWLQGFFEVANPKSLNEQQTAQVKEKLESCFMNLTSPKSGYIPQFDPEINKMFSANPNDDLGDIINKYKLPGYIVASTC